MRNIMLAISFDGTNYHGWQVQKNAATVQETLQDALEAVLKIRPGVTGCSRTDAFVHANAYVCNFYTDSSMPCDAFVKALNAKLPVDIAVKYCREVGLDFHSRYSALGKEYVYKIYNGKTRSPFLNRYALYYPYKLDCRELGVAAEEFLGEHDFSAFCSAGASVEDKVREIFSAGVECRGDMVEFTVRGNGFLYNMVRIMAGTLLYYAQGKIPEGGIADVIASGNREKAGPTAPAHGLYLNRVFYTKGE